MKIDWDNFKNGFIDGLNLMNVAITHILTVPLFIYQVLGYWVSEVFELNKKIREIIYLKRIHMTREEFDKFMDYKTGERDDLMAQIRGISSANESLDSVNNKLIADLEISGRKIKHATTQLHGAVEHVSNLSKKVLDYELELDAKSVAIEKLKQESEYLTMHQEKCYKLNKFLSEEYHPVKSKYWGMDCHDIAILIMKEMRSDLNAFEKLGTLNEVTKALMIALSMTPQMKEQSKELAEAHRHILWLQDGWNEIRGFLSWVKVEPETEDMDEVIDLSGLDEKQAKELSEYTESFAMENFTKWYETINKSQKLSDLNEYEDFKLRYINDCTY